ncbi:hypothetical protein BDV12DRAFT_189839 [Aspergillus spectabilis]
MWYLFLAVAAQASILPTPYSTALSSTDLLPPEPTPTTPTTRCESKCHELDRRDTTSAAEASICGYYEGSKNSRLACYYGNECVFHASDSNFPGMVGCCPTSSTTTPLSATPQLLLATTDPFVMLCTFDESSYCHTRTWPDLNVADVACTDEPFSRAETMYTAGSLTDITETISISWIADAALLNLRSASATTTGTGGTSATETSPSTQTATSTPEREDDEPEADGSSTPVGTIVGAVVGSVLGFGVIIAATVWIRWKRKKNSSEASRLSTAQNFNHDEHTAELHAGDASGRHELMAQKKFIELPAREVRHELE